VTLDDVRNGLAQGRSAQELTKACLAAIVTSETGPQRLASFISYDFDTAMAAAADIDARLADDRPLPLAGVPVAIKDNLCTIDYPTTCASRILANFHSPYDATVVRRLRAAGAVVVGKTNLDEFAMGSTTESSAFGRTYHPRDPRRVTGGSSGGSAAAVAAGLVPIALGSDTAGSVRQPAAFCGAVGFKPTYGRISRYGLIAYASSLDTVGIFANHVRDAARVFEVIAGMDEYDATTRAAPVGVTTYGDLAGVTIGLPREYFQADLHAGVRAACEQAIEALKQAGAQTRDVDLPHTRFAIPAYYALSTAEASSNLARYDGVRYGVRAPAANTVAEVYQRTRTIGFGTEVKRRIILGLHVLNEDGRATLRQAQRASALIAEDFERVFGAGVNLLFTPTTAAPAFISGEKSDPYELYLSDMLTVGANLAGIPAISIPIGTSGGLPVGGQLIAPPWAEPSLFRAAAALEQQLA
jgi:aspartyl-tRNA(Asn)/glutamyl-tRNA(Gln) amidotransferase subunit A